jgi:nucleoside-triphosphatase THEP1
MIVSGIVAVPDTMKKNIFLTGAPSSGKTTVIKKLLSVHP